MTYCGPYSQATLVYEPRTDRPLGAVAAPGTVLDVVTTHFPRYERLIGLAGMYQLYNDRSYASVGDRASYMTLFIADNDAALPLAAASRNDARDFCRASTTLAKLDAETLAASSRILLNTLSPTNDIVIDAVSDSGAVFANGATVRRVAECSNGAVVVTDRSIWMSPVAR
jgi:hypothetical protein